MAPVKKILPPGNTTRPPPFATQASTAFCTAAVSSLVPSPRAPKSRTLNTPALLSAASREAAPNSNKARIRINRVSFILCWRCSFLRIAIQGRAVERDHDDFAAVRFIPMIVLFWNVDDRQGDRRDVTIFEIDTGAFHLVPVIHGAVRKTHKIRRRVVCEAPQFPIVNTIHRSQ